MAFESNNVSRGLKDTDPFQVGRSDADPNNVVRGPLLPWPGDPLTSWVHYECTVEVVLDSGIAVHRRLPQIDNTPDTLASCLYEDPNFDQISGPGIALRSRDQYRDIVQRMGHSRHWFRLWGQALRVGYKIPIPALKSIGGVEVVPYDRNPQRAFNRIAPGGNYGGIILWHAAWSLWYTLDRPPTSDVIPAADAAAHIADNRFVITDDKGIPSPATFPDDNAVQQHIGITK